MHQKVEKSIYEQIKESYGEAIIILNKLKEDKGLRPYQIQNEERKLR
jgi:hypothetical protein